MTSPHIQLFLEVTAPRGWPKWSRSPCNLRQTQRIGPGLAPSSRQPGARLFTTGNVLAMSLSSPAPNVKRDVGRGGRKASRKVSVMTNPEEDARAWSLSGRAWFWKARRCDVTPSYHWRSPRAAPCYATPCVPCQRTLFIDPAGSLQPKSSGACP